jgi:hypothetical protein
MTVIIFLTDILVIRDPEFESSSPKLPNGVGILTLFCHMIKEAGPSSQVLCFEMNVTTDGVYHQNNLTHSAQCDQVIFICLYMPLHVSVLSKPSSEGPSTL